MTPWAYRAHVVVDASALVAMLTVASGLHYMFVWGRHARDVVRSRKETPR